MLDAYEASDKYDDYEDKSGMTVVSGTVTLTKNAENLIGISIGGGAPYCPCLYIVQLYDKDRGSEKNDAKMF